MIGRLSPESKTIRVFVAVQLPGFVRDALRAVQSELMATLPRDSAAWTRPANMHLTLRFLGAVDSTKLSNLSQSLRAAVAGFGPSNLICERLGCFPDLRFPRVVWAWVHDGCERLNELHQRVDAAVASFATKPAEARLVGHVTLARPKQIKRPDAERLAEFVKRAVDREFGRWRCQEVALMQSELLPAGSRYTTLDVFPL